MLQAWRGDSLILLRSFQYSRVQHLREISPWLIKNDNALKEPGADGMRLKMKIRITQFILKWITFVTVSDEKQQVSPPGTEEVKDMKITL